MNAPMTLHVPPIDPQAVCLRIRSMVELHGGPAVVANVAQMPQATLETHLQGKNLPGSLALAKLAVAMSLSVDWILFGETR